VFYAHSTLTAVDRTDLAKGAIWVVQNVDDRKRAEEEVFRLNAELEQRVAERTAQLAAANKELESFSYSVSHDLRAPLRAIDGFSKILLDRYAGKLDAMGRDYLRRVRAGARRMAALIDDLLALSRVTKTEMRRATLDLSELTSSIVAELKQAQPQRQVAVSITPGLIINADPSLMRVAMENLLSNAWKYSGKNSEARIEVGVVQADHDAAYFVRDNGVGFDMAYADKLFVAFQRLHKSNEFEGTGVGLATVQRIVQRHGGCAWIESAPNQGTTVYFTFAA